MTCLAGLWPEQLQHRYARTHYQTRASDNSDVGWSTLVAAIALDCGRFVFIAQQLAVRRLQSPQPAVAPIAD
jgi:hypothetical protein